MTTTAAPSKIRKLEERVAKYTEAVEYETGVIAEYDADLRRQMSRRNPRARYLVGERDKASNRLYTARQRLADAQSALDAAQPKPGPNSVIACEDGRFAVTDDDGCAVMNGAMVQRFDTRDEAERFAAAAADSIASEFLALAGRRYGTVAKGKINAYGLVDKFLALKGAATMADEDRAIVLGGMLDEELRTIALAEGAHTYRVTLSTPDGQHDEQTLKADDEGKAKTRAMALTTVRARGQRVTFNVEAL